MRTVEHLMRRANPVPNDTPADMERAERELAALLASGAAPPAGRPAARAPRRPRRALLVAAAATVAVAAAGVVGVAVLDRLDPSPPSSDEPFYNTTAKLETQAEVIVRARLESAREQTADGITETVARARIQAVAKGGLAAGETLEVAYTPVGSGPEAPVGLRQGGEYVLLLERRDATLWNLVNSTQGYYVVTDDRAVASDANSVRLSSRVRQDLGLR